ncbi:MAG: hypothetical protein CMP33_07655 [Rickettsiales bacterium]|nr:hypothetical protein [Rickettsiales bacterium]|tara:strand:+ start:6527 stop:6712 length:186 start_codon:yes stop_codon:yes gene_type:complete
MKEGPMKEQVDRDTQGVIKQVFITYRKKDGMLVKETTERKFYGDGDYNDSYIHEPLVNLEG